MDYTRLIAKKDADFNEEQTKHALVLPVLDQLLGWDIYDDQRLIPEFTADTPGKNGEKVDYALDLEGDGNPEVLIEVKPLGSRLSAKSAAQLYRYFTMTEAVIGVLTDGFRWLIYSDLDKPNVMDDSPFLDFTLEDLASKKSLERLFKALSREDHNSHYLREWGEAARDAERLRALVAKELSTPSDELTKHFFSMLHPGTRATSGKIEAFKTMLTDVLTERDPVEKIDEQLELKPKSNQPSNKVIVRRKGYFESSRGHRSSEGNLKVAWVSFWSEIVNDEELGDKLLELALDEKRKTPLRISHEKYTDPIGKGLFVYSTLSSAERLRQLEAMSKAIGVESKIVYTDGLDDTLEDDKNL